MSNKALDLDLEFEVESEKKPDAMEVDDLEFGVTPTNAAAKPKAPASVKTAAPSKPIPQKPQVSSNDKTNPNLILPKGINEGLDFDSISEASVANVKDLNQAREQKAKTAPTSAGAKPLPNVSPAAQSVSPRVAAPASLPVTDEVTALREEIIRVRESAAARVAVAEYKLEILLDVLLESKNLDSKVNQILNQIFKKAPATKEEVLMIKKQLLEFTQKMEKKKGSK